MKRRREDFIELPRTRRWGHLGDPAGLPAALPHDIRVDQQPRRARHQSGWPRVHSHRLDPCVDHVASAAEVLRSVDELGSPVRRHRCNGDKPVAPQPTLAQSPSTPPTLHRHRRNPTEPRTRSTPLTPPPRRASALPPWTTNPTTTPRGRLTPTPALTPAHISRSTEQLPTPPDNRRQLPYPRHRRDHGLTGPRQWNEERSPYERSCHRSVAIIHSGHR